VKPGAVAGQGGSTASAGQGVAEECSCAEVDDVGVSHGSDESGNKLSAPAYQPLCGWGTQ
jgi:hypothetical protein